MRVRERERKDEEIVWRGEFIYFRVLCREKKEVTNRNLESNRNLEFEEKVRLEFGLVAS